MTSVTTDDGDVEGYGIATVEAALCGKPSVVSDGSGLTEAVVDGVTGLVVPQRNPEATAHAIVQLLRDKSHREKMGESALRRAKREQTWASRGREYDCLFRQLLLSRD